MDYQLFLKQVLQESAEIAKRNFGKVAATSIKGKDTNQVVTETDLEIGKLIGERIKQEFPRHNILDEETGAVDNHSEYTWVIDPIDGTSNFASGVPLYGTMIGLLKKDSPIAGGISLPYFNEIYIAEKNKGAFCNGKKMHVTQETKLLSTLAAYTLDGHQDDPDSTRSECALMAEIILNIRNLRNSGSCFDAVMVAQGNYGAYLNRTGNIWDNAAQHIIIEEAGGVYTDFWGKPMDYGNPLTKIATNFTFCAAAPILHRQLQKIIHQKLRSDV